jgi:hypothetical protein
LRCGALLRWKRRQPSTADGTHDTAFAHGDDTPPRQQCGQQRGSVCVVHAGLVAVVHLAGGERDDRVRSGSDRVDAGCQRIEREVQRARHLCRFARIGLSGIAGIRTQQFGRHRQHQIGTTESQPQRLRIGGIRIGVGVETQLERFGVDTELPSADLHRAGLEQLCAIGHRSAGLVTSSAERHVEFARRPGFAQHSELDDRAADLADKRVGAEERVDRRPICERRAAGRDGADQSLRRGHQPVDAM